MGTGSRLLRINPVRLPGDFGKRCAGLGTSVLGQQVEVASPHPAALRWV